MSLFKRYKEMVLVALCLCVLILSCTPEKQSQQISPFAPCRLLQQGSYGFGDKTDNGSIIIKVVHDTDFTFEIEANHGDNQSQMDGVAQFLNDSQAFFREDNDVLEFILRKNAIIIIGRGLNGTPADKDFNGAYLLNSASATTKISSGDVGFLDPQATIDLKAKAGDHYDDLSDCMAKYNQEEPEVKDGASFSVYTGNMPGLFTLDEAIMLTRDHYYYAGLVFNDTVHLYTNDPMYVTNRRKLPNAITAWIPDMSHSRVSYHY